MSCFQCLLYHIFDLFLAKGKFNCSHSNTGNDFALCIKNRCANSENANIYLFVTDCIPILSDLGNFTHKLIPGHGVIGELVVWLSDDILLLMIRKVGKNSFGSSSAIVINHFAYITEKPNIFTSIDSINKDQMAFFSKS